MTDPVQTEEFVKLFTAHSRWIYSYIVTLIPAWNEADDVFQETSATLWRKFDQFQPGTSFRRWALSVTSYEIMQYRHRRKKQGRVMLMGDAFQEVIDQALIERAEKLDDFLVALERCMAELDEEQRVLLRHRHESRGTIQEIAAERGCSVWSLYRQLNRLYQMLHRCVNRHSTGESR